MKIKSLILVVGLFPAIAMAQAPRVESPVVPRAPSAAVPVSSDRDIRAQNGSIDSPPAANMVTMEPTKPMSISADGLQKPPLPPVPVSPNSQTPVSKKNLSPDDVCGSAGRRVSVSGCADPVPR